MKKSEKIRKRFKIFWTVLLWLTGTFTLLEGFLFAVVPHGFILFGAIWNLIGFFICIAVLNKIEEGYWNEYFNSLDEEIKK